MTIITTERLTLRPLTAADADWWVRLHADPEVNRFVGSYTAEQAAVRLAAIEEQWSTRGHGLCVVRLRATGEPIGRCGLNWWEQFDEVEAGWTLERPHWGRGYATEAATAVLGWGFGELGLERITAMIHPGNAGSTAVAARLGFTHLREDRLGDREVTVYGLDRSVWSSRGGSSPSGTKTLT